MITQICAQSSPKKYPCQQQAKLTALIDTNTQQPADKSHSILFEKIGRQLIHSMALKTNCSAAPSGMNSAAWKTMCIKNISTKFCNALAATVKKLCSQYMDPNRISAFVVCCLITLDKCPGVRPIGVGETVRQINGRAIATAISDDIQEAADPDKVCAGHLSGCEAAVTAMRKFFKSLDTEAAILTNAFNFLNRQAALQYIQHQCPSHSKALKNTYRENAHFFIDWKILLLHKGTTQGDHLAIEMYALAITPSIDHLEDESAKQIWYADNATACGKIRIWWDRIINKGPDYEYFPNATKTWLIVKEEKLDEVQSAKAQM